MQRIQPYKVSWHSKDMGYGLKVAVGDVNGDGREEIVAGTTYPGYGPTYLYIIGWRKRTYKTITKISLGSSQDVNSLAVGDVDGDGVDEIIVGGNNGIFVFKLYGINYKKIFSDETLRGKITSLAVGDIDGDGKDEIIAAGDDSRRLVVFNYRGGNFKKFIKDLNSKILNTAVGDTNGDGRKEIIVLTDAAGNSVLHIINFSRNAFNIRYSFNVPESPGRILETGDADNDGIDEIIFDFSNYRVYLSKVKGGQLLKQWVSKRLDDIPTAAVIADIDRDASTEIVVTTLESTYVYAFRRRRVVLELKHDLPNGIISIDVGDLNNNGINEIVVGTKYGYVYVLEARRDHRGRIRIGKVQTIFKETAQIPEGKPNIQKVVDTQIKVRLTDTIVLRDKVIVEGEVEARILYAADLPTQPVHFFHQTFSFLQIVNLYGAEPGMEAGVYFDVEYSDVDVIDPRSVETTVLIKTVVKLAPPWWD